MRSWPVRGATSPTAPQLASETVQSIDAKAARLKSAEKIGTHGGLCDTLHGKGQRRGTTESVDRFEVDLIEEDVALSGLGQSLPSRRAVRRAQREAKEINGRLRMLCEKRDLTLAIWRETTRDATFGFARGVRWHAIAVGAGGEIVAAVRDTMPLDAGEIKPRLIEQIEASA